MTPSTRKGKIMAEQTTPEAKTTIVEKKYTYFDLEKFDEVSETVQVTFTTATSVDEAINRIGPDHLLTALNGALRRMTFSAARRAVQAKGADTDVLNQLVNAFRGLYPQIKDRDEQRKAILAKFRSEPTFIAMLRKATEEAAANAEAADADSDE